MKKYALKLTIATMVAVPTVTAVAMEVAAAGGFSRRILH